jgi:hypothetical protein
MWPRQPLSKAHHYCKQQGQVKGKRQVDEIRKRQTQYPSYLAPVATVAQVQKPCAGARCSAPLIKGLGLLVRLMRCRERCCTPRWSRVTRILW